VLPGISGVIFVGLEKCVVWGKWEERWMHMPQQICSQPGHNGQFADALLAISVAWPYFHFHSLKWIQYGIIFHSLAISTTSPNNDSCWNI
jgi:hypothetical protein